MSEAGLRLTAQGVVNGWDAGDDMPEYIEELRKELAPPLGDGALREINEKQTARIEELEKELQLARDLDRARMCAILNTIGGTVEGMPTQNINYLRRLRELVKAEGDGGPREALVIARTYLGQNGHFKWHETDPKYPMNLKCTLCNVIRKIDAALWAKRRSPEGR